MKRLASPGCWPRTGCGKLALALAFFCAWLVGDHLLFEQSQTWRLLGIAPGPVPFFDTHNVLAALDCTRQGLDPLAENPCDAHQRPMNYPRLWLGLTLTGLGRGDEVWCGVVSVVAFVGAALWLAETVERRQWLVWLAAITSPAIEFGIARGNTDLWIFAALTLAIRLRVALPTVSAAAWALLSALKLYPAFAAMAWHRDPTRARPAQYCTAALLLYWLASSSDLVQIAQALPTRGAHTYGAANLGQLLAMGFAGAKLSDTALVYAGVIGRLGVAVLLLGTIAANRPTAEGQLNSPSRPLDDGKLGTQASAECPKWADDAFQAGAAIYVATYAVASHWNYRMVFLLLLLPKLLHRLRELDRSAEASHLQSDKRLVGLVLATLWTSGYPRFYLLYLDEWLALGLAVVLCGRLTREWLNHSPAPVLAPQTFVGLRPTQGRPRTHASGPRQSADR